MKRFKMLLGCLVVGSMMMVGCQQQTSATSENKQEEQVTQSTETTQEVPAEEKIEALGLDGERVQGEGFSVGIYEGWRQGVEEVVENTLTIRNDNYKSVITIVKQQGAGHMDIERLRKEMEEQTGFTTSAGKAACGEYMTVEIPKQIITEEHVKSMLESGQITQDLIDQNGGMESILATLNAQSAPSKQVYIPISNTSMIVVTTTLKEDEKEVIQQVFDFTVGSIVIE